MKISKPILLVILCCIIWGTTFTVVKKTSTQLNPFLLSTLRNLIASIILLSYLIGTKKTKLLKNRNGIINGSIIGLILAIIYIGQTIGIKYTTANNSAFITSITVVIVPIILIIFRKAILNSKQIISIIIVTIGLYTLTIKDGFGSLNIGDIITFGASFICATHLILSGYYVNKTEFLSLIFYQFFTAFIFSFLGYFIFKSTNESFIQLYSGDVLFKVLYLGVLGTFFCFFVTVWSQKYIGSIFLALIFSMEPIFASITNFVILNERFDSRGLLGAVVIFAGIIFYALSKSKNKDKTSII